MYNIN